MADDSTNSLPNNNKRTHGEANKPPPDNDNNNNNNNNNNGRKCAACNQWIPLSNFSKNQKSKGERARCKPCILVAAQPRKNNNNNNTNNVKQQQKQQQQQQAPPVPKKQKTASKIICSKCQKNKKASAFPKDQNDPLNNPTCVVCIVEPLAFPRHCQDCAEMKPKDQYSEWQHRLPSDLTQNKHSQKTTPQIEAMVKQVLKQRGNQITCKACYQIREEKRQREERERELAARAVMKQHGILFYDYYHPVPRLQYSPTTPENLLGTYDIIFHNGWCMGQHIQNRTTKGTVTITEGPKQPSDDHNDSDVGDDDNSDEEEEEEEVATELNDENGDNGKLYISGKVEFLPAMRSPKNMLFQHDFNLTQGSHSTSRQCSDDKYWVCNLRARMSEQEAIDVVHTTEDDYYCDTTLKCIAKRAGLGWMKYEEHEMNEEDDEKIKFETLEGAEALAREYEHGPDVSHSWLVGHKKISADLAKRIHGYLFYKPKPIFFLEPGDLILEVDWSRDMREDVTTECVLRRRND